MDKMSGYIIRLELASRRLRGGDFSPATKILELISGGVVSSSELAEQLSIKKSNLATLTTEMEQQGLIVKARSIADRREVELSLTKKGLKTLEDNATRLEDDCQNAFGSGYGEAVQKLKDALDVLELI